jgi:hypothetical protein
MAKQAQKRRRRGRRLPEFLRQFFWQYDFRKLLWPEDRELVIAHLLARGDWAAICWLRGRMNDPELADWITSHRGRGLTARQLRFWELILGIPRYDVDQWLRQPAHILWEKRRHP